MAKCDNPKCDKTATAIYEHAGKRYKVCKWHPMGKKIRDI